MIARQLFARYILFLAVEASLVVTAALTAPTPDIATAGVLWLLLGIFCTNVAFIVGSRPMAALLCGGGILIAAFALLGAAPLKGPLAHLVALTLPHVVFPVVGVISTNTLAYLILPAVTGAAAMASGASTRAVQFAWSALFSLGAIVLVATGSRSSVVALLLSMAIIAILSGQHQRPRRVASSAVILTSLVLLAGVVMWNDEAFVLRRSIWSQVSTRLGDAVGFGQFALGQMGTNPVLAPDYPPYNVHNVYLQTYLDFGLSGSIALLAIVAITLAHLVRALYRGREERDLVVGALAAMVALLAIGITESVLSTAYLRPEGLVVVVSPVPQIVIAFALAVGRDQLGPRD